MVVELFYLLAFIVGLGAFFVLFVLGSKKNTETKVPQVQKPVQIFTQPQDKQKSSSQVTAKVPNFTIISQEKQRVIASECQASQKNGLVQSFRSERDAQLVQNSQKQLTIMKGIQQFNLQMMQSPKFPIDFNLSNIIQANSEKQEASQKQLTIMKGIQNFNLEMIQNSKFAIDQNLPPIIEANSQIQGQSNFFQESEVVQKGRNYPQQLNQNEYEQNLSFIRQLNDENDEQAHLIKEQSLKEPQEQQIKIFVSEPILEAEQPKNLFIQLCQQMLSQGQGFKELKTEIDERRPVQNENDEFSFVPAQNKEEVEEFIQAESQKQQQSIRELVEVNSEYNEQVSRQQESVQYSRAERIENKQSRQRSRLQAMKNHYKRIIQELQTKLQQVCIRNNQSFSIGDADQTITFSEQDSVLDITARGEQAYFLEMKVEEVCTLKEQLKLQEQIITNLLEKDQQLKEKLQILEQENKNLKESVLVETKVPQFDLKASSVVQGFQNQGNFSKDKLASSQTNQQPVQPNNNLYTSHANFTRPLTNIFTSRADSSSLPQFSTISMISVIEGAISIGLLNECRFLNEISKRFAMNEVKKATKLKFIDSELIYSNYEIANEREESMRFTSLLAEKENLIFLIKLQNGKAFAFYIQQAIKKEGNEQNENRFVFINLNKRKSVISCGACQITTSCVTWGQQEIILKDDQLITIQSVKKGKIIASIQKTLELFQPEDQTLAVEFLYAYVLYPQG